MRKRMRRPSPALVLSLVALFVALGGTGYAAVKINGKNIKNGTVAGSKLKNQAVTAAKLKNKTVTGAKVKDNTLTGAQIDEGKLAAVPKALAADTAVNATNAVNAANAANAGSVAGYTYLGLERGTPTDGADVNAARAAAPQVLLYEKGPFKIYGKCFSTGGTLYVGTYISTTAAGSIFDSRNDELTGGTVAEDFLNPDSPETDREVNGEDSIGANSVTFDNEDENDFSAVAPNGTSLRGLLLQGAKQGTVALDGGAYGPGDGCLWGGSVAG